MGLLDIIEKVYDIIENVSAKSGKNMTGFTNATMNSSTLSKQTPEQLEEQKKSLENNLYYSNLNLEKVEENISNLKNRIRNSDEAEDKVRLEKELEKKENLETTIINLKTMIEKINSCL